MDVTLAGLPFESEAIARARPAAGLGVTLPVIQPEDLVVYKLVAHRSRDIDDAKQLLARHHAAIGLERVRHVLAEFSAAIGDDERLGTLAALCRELGL